MSKLKPLTPELEKLYDNLEMLSGQELVDRGILNEKTPMTKILIHSNHFITSLDNLGSINDQQLTLQSPHVDFQNNEFNITPPAKLKVPVYVKPDQVEDIGDVLRFHWKDSNTGAYHMECFMMGVDFGDTYGYTTNLFSIPARLKKPWRLNSLLIPSAANSIRIRIYNNDPLYSEKYGFHICLANLHYRNVLTDFADQSFGGWKVTQSAVNAGYDPAQYGIKQFDTYGAQPYSLWIEWPIGKKYEVGSWVEVATEI